MKFKDTPRSVRWAAMGEEGLREEIVAEFEGLVYDDRLMEEKAPDCMDDLETALWEHAQ